MTGDTVVRSAVLATEAIDAAGVADILLAQAERRPLATALRVVGDDGSATSVDYAGLDRTARGVAALLDGAVAPGDFVVLLSAAGPGFVGAFFGVAYAGCVPVPVALRPGDPITRAQRVAADCGARVVLVTDGSAAPEELDRLAVPGLRIIVAEASPTGGALRPERADLAFLQYTSGTTATPRGVVVGADNLLANLRLIRSAFAFDESSVMVSWLPAHHDMGLVGGILTPIYLGIPTVLLDPATFVRRPVRWLEAITRFGGTVSGAPNFAYDLCTRRVSAEERAGLDLRSWRVAFNGAETVRARTLAEFAAAFEPAGFDRSAWLPCYGLAEATLLAAGRATGEPPVVSTVPGDDGRATDVVGCALVPGVDVTVVDDEIWLRSASVARGYWGRADETTETFDGWLPDGRGPFLRTGDLGFVADGHLYVRGRRKDLIIVRGRNHHPDDVDATVQPLVPGRVVTFGVDGPDGDRAVVLYETTESDDAAVARTTEAIRQAVAAAHGLDLHDVVAAPPRTIPVTTSGKKQRARCAAAYAASAPHAEPARDAAGTVDAVIAEVLGLATLDESAPLSAVGLDSLRSLELQYRIEERFGVHVPLDVLVHGATTADLRAGIAEGRFAPVDPAAARATARVAPLSWGQRMLWFQAQLAPDAATLNLARALAFHGPLDVAALAAAVGAVGRRHAAFRTRFTTTGGDVAQEVTDDVAAMDVVDATAWDDARLSATLDADARRPFALGEGRLLRARLYRRADDDHVLLLATTHLAMDVWSLEVVVSDLAAAYAGNHLGPAPTPADFVAAEERWAAGDAARSAQAYWAEHLADARPLELPPDAARPATRTFRGAAHDVRLDAPRTAALRDLAAACGVSVPSLLTAAYGAVLGRFAGQSAFVLGYVTASRSRPRFADLVSYCVSLLPLTVDLADQPFDALAAAVGTQVVEAMERGEVSFGRDLVTATFAYQRGPARSPLAPLLMNHAGPAGTWGDVALTAVPVSQHACYFDLSLYAAEHGDELLLTFEYATDVFAAETVAVLAGAFTALLDGAAAEPGTPVARLPLLAPDEAAAALDTGRCAGPRVTECVHDLVARRAAETPALPAIVEGDVVLTYGDVDAAANRLAHRLARHGVTRGSLVGVLLPRSARAVVAVLGVLKSGAAYVPLDPTYPRERLDFMTADAAVHVLVVDESTAGLVDAPVVVDVADPELAAEPDTDPLAGATPDDAAYVVYTSGSTGTPNGVVGLHRGIVNRNRWVLDRYPFAPGELGSHRTSLAFFDSGGEMFLPLMAGAAFVVVPPDVGRDPARLVELLASTGVTRLVVVPSLLAAMLDAVPDAGERLARLRYLHSSGEALPAGLAARVRAALPGTTLLNLYGSSEISADVTVAEVGDGPVTVGRPIANTSVYVLDESLTPMPPRFSGEVYVGGAGLARGYHGRPDLTAAKFVPDPFGAPGERLFRTGDRMRWTADGELEYLGRVDHQVQIRGHRVELGEVEAALRGHPGVRAAALTAEVGPGGDPRLVAAVVPDEDHLRSLADSLRTDRVEHWRDLYDRIYRDAGDDTARQDEAWTNSYTGEPFSPAEMAEWIDEAAARIRATRPRRVLEIGCGTGNILLNVASACDTYLATDMSAAAVDHVRARLAPYGDAYAHVTVVQADAADLSVVGDARFDTVVLNSVVQYFPSEEYLADVLREAVRVVEPGGRVFVGDVRDLDLLDAFLASVAAAGTDHARASLTRAVADELLLSRAYFLRLPERLPDVAAVDVQVKRGRHWNELTKFRYDVTLHCGAEPRPVPGLTVLDWAGERLDPASLRARLLAHRGAVEVLNVPNARLAGETAHALDPEHGWTLGRATGREVEVVASSSGDPYAMNLRFHPPGALDGGPYAWSPVAAPVRAELASTPLHAAAKLELVADLRRYLRRTLPTFMVPVVTVRDALPMTPSGKIDRRSLTAAAPAAPPPPPPVATAEPATAPTVAAIWSEVLGVEDIGPDENFFDVGGSSLSLVQVHLRLQAMAGTEFPLVDLYEHTTIRLVAEFVDALRSAAPAAVATDGDDDPHARTARRRDLLRRRRPTTGSHDD